MIVTWDDQDSHSARIWKRPSQNGWKSETRVQMPNLFADACPAGYGLTPAPRVDIITQSRENGGLSGGHRNWKAILLRQVRRRVRRHARLRAGKYPLLRRADEQEVSDRRQSANPRFRGRRRRSAAPPFPVQRQRQKGEHANAQPTRTTLPMRDVRDNGPLHEARPGRDPLLRGGNAGAAAAKAALVRLGAIGRSTTAARLLPGFAGVNELAIDGRPPLLPRHSRESGNPDGCSQARYPKSSTNRERQIPSPFMGEG